MCLAYVKNKMPFTSTMQAMQKLGFRPKTFRKHLKFALAMRCLKNPTTGLLMFLLAPKSARILRFFRETPHLLSKFGDEIDRRQSTSDEASRLRLLILLKISMKEEVPELHCVDDDISFDQAQVMSKALHLMLAASCVELSPRGKSRVLHAMRAVDKSKMPQVADLVAAFERNVNVADRCAALITQYS